MSCDCDSTTDPNHVPCTPCAQMAKAITRVIPPHSFQGSQGLGAATDDLTTIQQFLQNLSTGVPPTETEIATAQAAATALSVDVFPAQHSSVPADSWTVKKTAVVMGGVALVLGGASLAYLYKTSPKRGRR